MAQGGAGVGRQSRLISDRLPRRMSQTWLIVFVVAFVVGLAGLFLYGWGRRKEKPPPGVKPLKDDDDDWGR